ncbi:MAG: histidine triad nucleotide-binding protein [Anaerolineae bacterium]|nr:histidine triad nucleotide-binding protein [Anaerolineae bacterium]MDW8100617.1 histidine triad nucleotide-binding protein [Anaerolineae bacterium]
MSDARCVFCRIVRREAPADIVYQDEEVVAFRDINPQAPVHVLIVPRRHIPAITALGAEDGTLAGRLMLVARELAEREGIARSGYRLVINNGPQAGQSIDHLHVHLLGGRHMRWPPG